MKPSSDSLLKQLNLFRLAALKVRRSSAWAKELEFAPPFLLYQMSALCAIWNLLRTQFKLSWYGEMTGNTLSKGGWLRLTAGALKAFRNNEMWLTGRWCGTSPLLVYQHLVWYCNLIYTPVFLTWGITEATQGRPREDAIRSGVSCVRMQLQ